jgi:hypothetical protein
MKCYVWFINRLKPRACYLIEECEVADYWRRRSSKSFYYPCSYSEDCEYEKERYIYYPNHHIWRKDLIEIMMKINKEGLVIHNVC